MQPTFRRPDRFIAMPRYLRLTYASRSTFPASREDAGFPPEVGSILMQSRRNNARRRLSGGLYYADGCFFQVLEGRQDEVEALYARLQADPRHRDLRVLDRREIPEPAFRAWAMKHVPDAPEVRSLMARHGRVGFDPYSFPPALVEQMVSLLLDVQERPTLAPEEEDAPPRMAKWLGLVAGTLLAASLIGLLGMD